MANNTDFIVKNGLQVSSNLVVGSYTLQSTPIANGAIISGSVGIGTSLPASTLYVAGKQIISNVLTSNTLVYTGKSLDVSGQEANPFNIFFSPDGKIFYLIGTSGNVVDYYNLDTPWDISTATFAGSSPSLAAQNGDPVGVYFDPTGTKMWMTGNNTGIYEYNLSIPWNVSSSSLSYSGSSIIITSSNNAPRQIYWKPDGTSLFVVFAGTIGTNPRSVVEFKPATQWTLAGISNTVVSSLSIASQELTPTSITFTSDGATMLIIGSNGDEINVYDLSEPWALTTARHRTQFSLPSMVSNITAPTGTYLKPDGSAIYITNDTGTGAGACVVYQFDLGNNSRFDLVGNALISGDVQILQNASVAGQLSGWRANFNGNVGIGTSSTVGYNDATFAVFGNIQISNVAGRQSSIRFPDGSILNSANIANVVIVDSSTNNNDYYVPFVDTVSGSSVLRADSEYVYNPSTNRIKGAEWAGKVINVDVGGTGFTTVNNGDLLYGTNDSLLLGKLPIGTIDKILTTNGSELFWGAVNLSNLSITAGQLPMSRGGTSSDLTPVSGSILYSTSGNVRLAPTNQLFFDNVSGNFGLGTASPTQRLDVRGNIYTTASIWAGNISITNSTAATSTTTGALTVAGGVGVAGSMIADGQVQGANLNVTGANLPTNGLYLPTTNTLGFVTNSTERMRLTSTGGLSIGTSTGTNALDVLGGVAIGNYAGNITTSANTMIVSGQVGIGTSNPSLRGTSTNLILAKPNSDAGLWIAMNREGISNVGIGASSGYMQFYVDNLSAGYAWSINGNGYSVLSGYNVMYLRNGRLWVGAGGGSAATNNVDVYGNQVIGRNYAGVSSAAAPADGLAVQGKVGIGTSSVYGSAQLTVLGNVYTGNSAWIGNISITNSTAATSTTTGALTVAGGVGISGNLYVAGNLIVNGNVSYINSNITVIEDPSVAIGTGPNGEPLTTSDSYDRGLEYHYYANGGDRYGFIGWQNSTGQFVYISNATAGSTTGVYAGALGDSAFGNITIGSASNTPNPSTSTSTGALIIQGNGGIGVGGNLYVGGRIFGVANTAFNASNISVTSTITNATFYPTFVEATNGNIGIRTDPMFTFNPGANQLTLTGNAAIQNSVSVGNISVTNTSISTNSSTGALTVAGGIGVAGNLFVGGSINGANVNVTGSNAPPNGIWLPVADTLGFSTKSTESMRINSSGNVGIRVTNPLATLHSGNNLTDTGSVTFSNVGAIITSKVTNQRSAQSNVMVLSRSGQSGVVYAGLAMFDMSAWGFDSVWARTQLDIKLSNTLPSDLTNVLTLRSDGRIGIGTTVPSQILDVAGNVRIANSAQIGNLSITNTTASTSSTTGALTVAGGVGVSSNLFVDGSINGANVNVTGSNAPPNGIWLPTANTLGFATNSSEKMRISSVGYVGIGTTIPNTLLDVGTFNTTRPNIITGSFEFQSYALNNSHIGENVYYDGSKFAYRRTGAAGLLYFAGSYGGFRWAASGTAGANAGMAGYQLKTAVDGTFAVGPAVSGSAGVYTGATFFVNPAGQVGIGTSSVYGQAQLTVIGNVYTASGAWVGNISVTNTTVSTSTTTGALTVAGGVGIAGNVFAGSEIFVNGNVGIGTTVPVSGYILTVNGGLAATTKSFVIPHPTRSGMKLQYASLEGPENGVYIRGKLDGDDVIDLPAYWEHLVDPDTITVHLTPYGSAQSLYVKNISAETVTVASSSWLKSIKCFYTVYAERKDVPKLKVEI